MGRDKACRHRKRMVVVGDVGQRNYFCIRCGYIFPIKTTDPDWQPEAAAAVTDG